MGIYDWEEYGTIQYNVEIYGWVLSLYPEIDDLAQTCPFKLWVLMKNFLKGQGGAMLYKQ